MSALDDFREQSQEPTTDSWRITVRGTETGLWVGVYDTKGPLMGGRHVWSRRYDRPPGKTSEQLLEAALTAVSRAVADGFIRHH